MVPSTIIVIRINPIRPGVPEPGNNPGRGHKVPGFNLRALDCCLALKLFICFQKYKFTSHEKKIGLNLKKSVRF